MKFLDRKDIDTDKWNNRIQNDPSENIFCYTWYLDATAENWGALVSGDYDTILPVPFTSKLGVKRFYQAPFTREYTIFGNDFGWTEAITFLKEHFSHLDFRTSMANVLTDSLERVHQELELNENYNEGFRSNAKRLIKKGHKNFHFHVEGHPADLIQLFQETVGHKINAIGSEELKRLEKLMDNALKDENAEMIIAKNENGDFVAGGFFLKDKTRITYLKGAATEEAKKLGAMYALFDFAFERYLPDFDLFDFGGSDVENVATFYKKFGAIDRKYYNYTLDKTPFWFKALKKMKKS